MYPPPWAHNHRLPDLPYLFGRPRSHHRSSDSHSHCPDHYGIHGERDSKPSYTRPHKPRFSEQDTPSPSDFSCQEWDDPYALDTDDTFEEPAPPPLPSSRRRFSARPSSAPDLARVSLTLPSATAHHLRPTDILILPPLVHLQIKIFLFGTRTEELRAAVPGPMTLGDVSKQILRTYVPDNLRRCDVTVRVEQRGRMKEPAPSTAIEELTHRGEVFRDGRREVKVEILVGDEDEWMGSWDGYGGRGPRGSAADVETGRKRESSRTRVVNV